MSGHTFKVGDLVSVEGMFGLWIVGSVTGRWLYLERDTDGRGTTVHDRLVSPAGDQSGGGS